MANLYELDSHNNQGQDHADINDKVEPRNHMVPDPIAAEHWDQNSQPNFPTTANNDSSLSYSRLEEDPRASGYASSDFEDGISAITLCDGEYTVEEAVDAMGFGWFQIMISGIVGFNWMADAFEIMLVSVLSDKLMCEWHLGPWEQALITTFVFSGYFLGAPVWGLIGDKYGRRWTLGLSSFYIFLYGFLSAFSPTFAWVLILRGLVGVSLGGSSQSAVIYAEFLPAKRRGLCLVFLEVFWVLGACLEVFLALVIMPTLGWRYLLAFSSAPLLIFLFMMKFLPESTLYQQVSGDMSGAMETLKRISRMNSRPLPPGRLRRKVELKPKGAVRELFRTKELAITSILLLILWFCNAFLYYGIVLMSTEIFSSGNSCAAEPEPELECQAACKSLDSHGYLKLLESSFAEFPGIFLTLVAIEVLGRKWTMGVEMLIATLFVFLLLICSTSNVQLAIIFVARATISGAFQALYVYTPEVFPTHVRSIGMGLCVAASRMGAILTPFIAQVMIKHSVMITICTYGVFCLLASIVSVILPVETKGRILH
ncbi:synaptic vesicle 2-related protein-like [Diadema antillarum]|uniref:synaptic vesicle 2-related protein-like n=1 Tax=Diadema antillarum TaxID=105358 RepID=UPI003A83E5EF